MQQTNRSSLHPRRFYLCMGSIWLALRTAQGFQLVKVHNGHHAPRQLHHALILREDDPLLTAVLQVYEAQGIRHGAPQNQMKGPAFQTELATAYPECRLVVTKETMTVEGMIKIVYDLLKDKLNIAKITFTSGVNAASAEFVTKNQIDRCPLCGIALHEDGVCPKCGYRKG